MTTAKKATTKTTSTREAPTTKPPATVYYASCMDAKAAGAAPPHVGDPGYRISSERALAFRLEVNRTPAEQDALVRDAAAACGQSLTDFVTTAVVTRAADTLADRRVFRLDEAAWTEFTTLLDRPARRIPALAQLLVRPEPWDED